MLTDLLNAFGLPADQSVVHKLSTGLINLTWKITVDKEEYILQRINKNVFKSPIDISDNIERINNFLAKNNPEYLFVSALEATDGKYLIQDQKGDFYRLMPFIKNSHTIDTVNTEDQAFEAAKQFGQFTSLLSGFDINCLKYTLPDFHNLSLRFEQFKEAYTNANEERRSIAQAERKEALKCIHIVDTYNSIIKDDLIPLRVIHHDTKISNVLFDRNDKGLCVIDLDTVMPGYFISDVGDMMRTYLSPANEEEQDLSKISVREEYFKALIEGYLSEMGNILNQTERNLIIYAGKFMIYMQAIRFLSDFLNGDVYYSTTYPKHNLIRAQNQFILLNHYQNSEENFIKIIDRSVSDLSKMKSKKI
jgi:Ser/Thr protein kinase RdoA (MazF antagonist)